MRQENGRPFVGSEQSDAKDKRQLQGTTSNAAYVVASLDELARLQLRAWRFLARACESLDAQGVAWHDTGLGPMFGCLDTCDTIVRRLRRSLKSVESEHAA